VPDVLAVDVIWPGDFAQRGWIAPLDDYFTDAELAEYLPGFAAAAQIDGSTYAIPLYIDGIHLFYRSDLLAKYGFEPPRTWEELIAQSRTILEGEANPDLTGFVSMWAKIEGLFMNYLAFLYGAGGTFFGADGELAFDGPEGVQALQTMVDMLYEDQIVSESVLTFRPDDARILFQQGRAVFMMVQDFVLDPLTAADSPVRDVTAFTRVPVFEGAPADAPSTVSGGFLLAVNAYSQHKEAAADLIRCFTSYDAQVTATLLQGKVPVRASVYADARVQAERPVVAQLGANFEYALTRPSAATGTAYPEISEIMQTEISAALLRQKTPEQALRDAATQVRFTLP
jgi:multiple sugar transport system substrate-binding protein